MVAFPEVQLLRKPDGKAIKLMRGHTHQVYDLLIEALTDLLDDNRLPGATDAQIACMAHNAILEELRRRKSRMTIHEKLEEMKREIARTELYSKARGKLSAPALKLVERAYRELPAEEADAVRHEILEVLRSE